MTAAPSVRAFGVERASAQDLDGSRGQLRRTCVRVSCPGVAFAASEITFRACRRRLPSAWSSPGTPHREGGLSASKPGLVAGAHDLAPEAREGPSTPSPRVQHPDSYWRTAAAGPYTRQLFRLLTRKAAPEPEAVDKRSSTGFHRHPPRHDSSPPRTGVDRPISQGLRPPAAASSGGAPHGSP